MNINCFNIGDKVRYTVPNSALTNAEGIVVDIDLLFCAVEFKDIKTGLVYCDNNSLELITDLPIGKQSLLNAKKCDCGGMKVFGSDSPAIHSPWCSSIS